MSSALLIAMVLCVTSSAFAVDNPILAAGSVSFNGTLQKGTSNITTSYNSTRLFYQIHINGVCFVRTQHTHSSPTVSGYNGYPQGALFVNTDDETEISVTGDMIVGLRDVDGTLEQADFQFVVYQK